MEELLRKKEEFRRNQLMELRKKKMEEEIQKKQEEEFKENRKKEILRTVEEWEKNKILQMRRAKESDFERLKESLQKRMNEKKKEQAANTEFRLTAKERFRNMITERKTYRASMDSIGDHATGSFTISHKDQHSSDKKLRLNKTGTYFKSLDQEDDYERKFSETSKQDEAFRVKSENAANKPVTANHGLQFPKIAPRKKVIDVMFEKVNEM